MNQLKNKKYMTERKIINEEGAPVYETGEMLLRIKEMVNYLPEVKRESIKDKKGREIGYRVTTTYSRGKVEIKDHMN